MEDNLRLKCVSILAGNLNQMLAFQVKKEGGFLGNYLAYRNQDGEIKSPALEDEKNSLAKTYLIIDDITGELVGYFSLKAGFVAITQSRLLRRNTFDAIPGLELSNFAVNEVYKQAHPKFKGIGYIIFNDFILPTARKAQTIVGIKILYIFALPRDSLVKRYEVYGFTKLSVFQQKNMHRRFKPNYDKGCIFMYQIL